MIKNYLKTAWRSLSTARALVRAREVSIRKVIGASKRQLFIQFMLETTVLFILVLMAAFTLIFLLLPVYNGIAGKVLHFSLADAELWKVIGYSALGTLLAASIYPALLLAGFHPLKTMKGNVASGGTTLFRKGLVVFQFAIHDTHCGDTGHRPTDGLYPENGFGI